MGYSPYWFSKNAAGASRGTASNFQNNTGVTINKATPVCINSSGNMVPLDISNESTVLAMVGLTNAAIPNAAMGGVQDGGRLEDVSVPFSVGDPLWVSKSGGLTNNKPSAGSNGYVSGDFVIFVGMVVKNEFTPSLKDIKLMISIIGQL